MEITVGDSKVIIDDEDFEFIRGYSWRIYRSGYVAYTLNGKTVHMHRLVMGAEHENIVVHHKNENKLDNRKVNLIRTSNSRHTQIHSRKKLSDMRDKFKSWLANNGFSEDSYSDVTLRKRFQKETGYKGWALKQSL